MSSSERERAVEPNDAQKAIINSNAPRLIVSAGAGTGKTATLAARYVRLVEDGISPSAILCITYTKKAAAEMKTRIVKRLTDAGRIAEAQLAETGPIQTIDSFFQRILRENAIAAGLDPGFEFHDETAEARIRESAVKEVLLDPPIAPHDRPAFDQFVEILAQPTGTNKAKTLENATQLARDLIESWSRQYLQPEDVRARLAKEKWREAEDQLLRSLLSAEVHAALAEDSTGNLRADLTRYRAAFPKDFAKQVPEAVRKLLDPVDTSLEDDALAQAAVQFATAVWERVLIAEERLSRFSFVSIERRTVRMIEENPVIADRLRKQFLHVLVDESQDLNPLRHRFLDALNPQNLLMVGDGQQSIYSFQGADLSLFGERARRSEVERHDLVLNYRSRPAILTYVDRTFSARLGEAFLALTPHRPESETVEASSDPDDIFGTAPPAPCIYQASHQSLNEASLKLIRHLRESGVPYGQMALLWRLHDRGLLRALEKEEIPFRVIGGNRRFWVKQETRDLANILQAISDPNDRLALLAALRSPAGGLSRPGMLHVAACLDSLLSAEIPFEDPADAAAWERWQSWFPNLVQLADHLPAWEVLSRVLADSPLLVNSARYEGRDQAIANIRKMLEEATKRPEEGLDDLVRTLRNVRQVTNTEGEAELYEEEDDLLTVITIHKAKGLEWDAVVVHHASRGVRPRNGNWFIDHHSPLFGLSLNGRTSRCYDGLKELAFRREKEELVRLDYVATTRARNHLALNMSEKRKDLLDPKGVHRSIGFTSVP